MSTPNSAPSGPPLRALAMVLIALAILFAGLGALSWSSDTQSESAAAATSATTTTQPAAAAPASVAPASGSVTTTARSTTTAGADEVVESVTVRVFNNSTVAGLAAEMASRLRNDGWNVTETGNYTEGELPETTVYYGDAAEERQAATLIAEEIGATAAPRVAGISDAADGVIVILTAR